MWDAFGLDSDPCMVDAHLDGPADADMEAYEYKFMVKIVEVGRSASGEIRLTWSSRPGHTHIVSVCPDLATWQWIGVATGPSQGFTTSWADSGLPANRRMFYRIDLH